MNNKGYNTIELAVVLGVFTVVYFVTAFLVSGNFKGNFEIDLYNQKIKAIEKQAALYAEYKDELFEESDTIYMTVGDFAIENIFLDNKEAVITDPRDSSNTLNGLKIKLTKDDEKVIAKVLS